MTDEPNPARDESLAAQVPTLPDRPPREIRLETVPEGYDGPAPVAIDRPHFPRTVLDGTGHERTVCGQDGQTWPCPGFQQQQEAAAAPTGFLPTGGRYTEPAAQVSLEAAARAAGMSPEELQARMRENLGDSYGTYDGLLP